MSGQKFAERAGIKYTTFANWLQQCRKRRPVPSGTEATEEIRWVEVVVGSCSRPKTGVKPTVVSMIVHGPGGVRIEIHEEKQVDWAAKLLRQLDEARAC
jgi:hypothetical protein